jgi:chromosome segregation ATPase
VAQKLTPKLTAVHEAIAEAARDTKDKLDAWQANRSPASALAYDESVSRGIDSVSQALDNFLAERDGVLAAVGELGDSLGKGDASFRQKAGDYQKRAKERHEQARKLREALTELSIQYAGYVRDKKPLPLEADERARELASTLGTLETREKVLQAAAEEFKRFTGSVGTYQQVVQRYRAEYRLLFREGENAQALLADVAVSHADLKELQAVVAEVNGLGEELKGLKVRLAEVTKGLGDFLSVAGPATAGDPEAKVRAVSTDLTGTEILAGFASPEVARANR